MVEAFENRKNLATYRVLLLRGRREASHIEIIEYVEAQNPQEAVDLALSIAEKYKWHLEKVERLLSKPTEKKVTEA